MLPSLTTKRNQKEHKENNNEFPTAFVERKWKLDQDDLIHLLGMDLNA